MTEKAQKVYVCKWCGAEYATRQGLAYHKKVCEYRPTDDDTGGPDEDTGGINIFDDDGPDADDGGGGAGGAAGVDEENTYVCPVCGYEAAAPYNPCPGCGAGLVWN